MKIRMLGSAASVALMIFCAPAAAVTSPEMPLAANYDSSTEQAVNSFYESRGGAPLWLTSGADGAAARALIETLERASLDGMPSGPAMASQAQVLIARAQAGDQGALSAADRLLSSAWIQYVETIQKPPAGITYADRWVAPRQDSPATILAKFSVAPSPASYVRSVARVNPLYSQLRDAAWEAMQSSGGQLDPRVIASLDRVRDIPPQGRYVIVDTAGARLYMIDEGRIVDSMKVIVGKSDPTTQTPMIASTIYYATVNPYWHVSSDMVRSLIARNVLEQGMPYLRTHGYQVFSPDGSDHMLDPAKVNWRAVAAGSQTVQVRQLPGPLNSMGRIKIPFPNSDDIYLHDTPNKDLFAADDRTLSHGCIRLQDAERLGSWLMGRDPRSASSAPEANVLLPSPVPIYVTYLTAQVSDGRLSYVDDIYGRDREVAALR